MSELDQRRNVPERPAAPLLPEPFQRSVRAEPQSTPDIQGAVMNYAKSTNWLSEIGSFVAEKASNELATQMGTELGKNPKGDLGIPFTDFDKTLHKSYQTQAQATLGIQAHKLIVDANLEMSKAPRITQDLIEQTNKNISFGLQNIFKNAPAEIRPQLQYQYTNQQMTFLSQMTNRMIDEQREDMKNNTIHSSNLAAENVYLAEKNGQSGAAKTFIESTERANEVGVEANVLNKNQAKVNTDSVKLSGLKGKVEHEYDEAAKAGKSEQFLRQLADRKDIPAQYFTAVANHILAYDAQKHNLRRQDEQLRTAKINTSIAKDVTGITGAQLEEYRQNVSPIQFEQTQAHYIKAMKTAQQNQNDMNATAAVWSDPNAFSRLTEKSINQAFDTLVPRYIQQREKEGIPISRDDAEVQVAASAGGKVPVFSNAIKNKINSGNPAMMESAFNQVESLGRMNRLAAAGLSEKDESILASYGKLRDSLPPPEAAKVAIENANQDKATRDMVKENWSDYLTSKTKNQSSQDFALKEFNLNKSDFMNPAIANVYGQSILEKYQAYFQYTKGDEQSARALTQKHVNENYGYTGVNGAKFLTLHPIEKVLGYPENSDVVPFIQSDVMHQLEKKFEPSKKQFDEGKSNQYWEVLPKSMDNQAFLGREYSPIEVKRYMRTREGVKTDKFNVILIGNSFNWDISLVTSSGIRPISSEAPFLGVATYTPNVEAINREMVEGEVTSRTSKDEILKALLRKKAS